MPVKNEMLGEIWNPARAKQELDKFLAKRGEQRSQVGGAVWPVPGGVISQGVVPGHTAIDIIAGLGAPIVATHPGRVTAVYPWSNGKRGYGRNVRVLMADGIEALYGHLQGYAVKVGDILKAGQQIGTMGATGTKMPHLHLEYRRPGADVWNGQWSTTTAVDPLPFLSSAVAQIATPIARAVQSVVAPTARPSVSVGTANVPGVDNDTVIDAAVAGATTVAFGVAGDVTNVAASATGDVFGLGDIVEKVKPSVERLMYGGVGVALMVVGLIILAISFKDEIRETATYVADVIKPVTQTVGAVVP